MTQIVSKPFKLNVASEEQDRLTGLYNRKAGLEKLTLWIHEANAQQLTFFVALLDINDLNIINKEWGHDEGDKVIRLLSNHIIEKLSGDDFAIRISGDEFLIIFGKEDEQYAKSYMNDIIFTFQKDGEAKGYETSFSYGMIQVDTNIYKDTSQIIIEADNRMYRFKKHYHFEKSRNHCDFVSSDEARNFIYDEEYLLEALMQSSDDYIYVCNMREDPSTFRYSKAMVDEFALPGEVIRNAAEVWGAYVHEADQKVFLESNQEIADGLTDSHNVEYRARNKEGKWVWLRCRGHVERDNKGNAVLFAGFITLLNRKNKVDYLTGLFNIYEFEDTIHQLTIKEKPSPFYILKLDIDDFGSINKLYNNLFGDQILEIIAQRLQFLLPQDAKIFRCESDEFFIVLRNDRTQKEIIDFYTLLQKNLSHQQTYNGKKYHCTISAGCANYPEDGADYMTLTKSVNYALEYSKKTGKNRLTFFDKDMLKEEMRELDMMEQLRYSVEHNFEGFRLNFQPQVDAKTGRIVGSEALCRWKCDMYGNVAPLVFIPLLEKSGMILPVGRWIFEQAVKQCKTWLMFRPDFGVSINLSYLQLNDSGLLAFMEKTLRKYDVSAKNIVVEMTESCIMKSEELVKDTFDKIRQLGIRIAMDDFGTGYSSLGALKTVPADIVKIDKIFMQNILESEFDATFIKFVVRLCHDVGISVLLEGVETKEEYYKVRELGLDYIQGYYFGKPMDSDNLIEII